MSEWKEYSFSDFATINPTVKLPSNEFISFVEMKDLDSGKRFCYPSSERVNGSGAKFEEYHLVRFASKPERRVISRPNTL